jgi:hypothetical protein
MNKNARLTYSKRDDKWLFNTIHTHNNTVNPIENKQILMGYFYMRLADTDGSYTPKLSDIVSMSLRYCQRPTAVFNVYEHMLENRDF